MEVSEVRSRADELKSFWEPRNIRIRQWLQLEALSDKNLQADTMSYVSNEPQVMLSLATHLLTAQPIRYRVVSPKGSEQKKASESERALISIWREKDEEFSDSGQGASWDRALAYWMCLTGWYAIADRVETNPDGSPEFIADLLNPMDVFPQYTGQHLQSVAHFYSTNVTDIYEKAELWGTNPKLTRTGDPKSRYTVIDYWFKPSLSAKVHNIVIVDGGNGSSLLKPEVETHFDRIPIRTGPVGGSPFRGTWDNSEPTFWQQDAGRSILEPNRQTIDQMNMWMSFLAEVGREAAQDPYFFSGVNVTQKDLKRPPRAGHAILSTKNEKASASRALSPARFPIEMQTIIQVLDGERQRGGFPYVLYGGVNINLSGFAINQLLSAATKLIGPQKLAMQKIKAAIGKNWLESYRKYKYPPITIAGHDVVGDEKWYMEDFSSDRIPPYLFVEAEIKIDLPSDLMNRVQILRTALGNNVPIMDLLTGLEDILKVEDPYGILERIKSDMAQYSQEGTQVRLYEGFMTNARELREEGGPENNKKADALEQFAAYLLDRFNTLSKPQQGAQPTGTGIQSNQQPAEASGRSPDMMRQLLGLPPAGANVVLNNTLPTPLRSNRT